MIRYIFILLAVIFLPSEAWSSDYSFYADSLFHQKKYGEALQSYESMLQKYPSDVHLLYNAGTTAIRQEVPAKAMLYLERALKYDPSLEDAQVNLVITKKKLGAQFIDTKPTIWVRIWHLITCQFDSNEWLIIFIYMSTVLVVLRYLRTRLRRSQYVGYSYIIGALAILAILASFSIYRTSQKRDHAIIMNPSRLYQDASMTRHTKIKIVAGQKCKILNQKDNTTQILLPNGMTTYISSTAVERI